MHTHRLGSLAVGSLIVVALGVACSSDDDDGAGAAGKGGASAGAGNKAGSSNHAGGSSGSGLAGGGREAFGGEAGAAPGLGGGGRSDAGQGGDPGAMIGGAGGEGGGEAHASCETVRSTLLGPIASVSTGLVEVTSDASAAIIELGIDASAGGYMAAANNPYIYLNLANKARVDVDDIQADSSVAWDLAFKRDNLRSNGGDSGPGNASIATLAGADFDTTTAAAAASAEFQQDDFIDPTSCAPIVDAIGKPLTPFDGWYEYDEATMGLTPADKIYLVRAADGTSLYKLEITGYYQDASDGMGGTVKKSAVYSVKYQAL